MPLRQQNSAVLPISIDLWDTSGNPVVGVTPTLSIRKNGGTLVSASGTVGVTDSNGTASWAGNSTDRNTLGELRVYVSGTGAVSYDFTACEIVPYDPFDGVRLGLTALPNAAAGSNGGVPTVDASNNVHGLQTRTASDASVIGTSTYAGGAVASVTGAVGSVTGNVGGNVVGSVASVTGSVGSVTGAVGSVTGAVGSVTGNVGGNVVGSVASVTAGVTVATNGDKTGYALTAAYDAAKSAAAPGAAMALATGAVTATSIAAAALNGKGDWLLATNYTAPDNADIATALADLVTLLGRTDPTTAIAAIQTTANAINTKLGTPAASVSADIAAVKTDTSNLIQMTTGTGTSRAYTVPALANAPAGGGSGTIETIQNINAPIVNNPR